MEYTEVVYFLDKTFVSEEISFDKFFNDFFEYFFV